jgi:serine/threonine-protein kinase
MLAPSEMSPCPPHRIAAVLFRRVAAVCLVATLSEPLAFAQTTSDKVAAESLFDQGRDAMRKSDFARACGLLEKSQRIDPAVGTLLYLGECYEKSGRTASAWVTFREAADAADTAHESARARAGRDRAARLEPLLSRLTIQVGEGAEQVQGLTIERRGQPVPTATWNVPVPVDPGDYTINVSAPGYEPWSTTVSVPAKAGGIAATVPTLKKLPEAEKPAAVPAPVPSSPPPPEPPPASTVPPAVAAPHDVTSPPSEGTGSGQRTAAYVIGGVGVVGIGVGSYFGLRAISKSKTTEDLCGNQGNHSNCTDPGAPDASNAAHSAARISNIAFAAGGALLVGGVILYLSAPHATSASAGTAVRASIGPTGVALQGSF